MSKKDKIKENLQVYRFFSSVLVGVFIALIGWIFFTLSIVAIAL